MRARWIRVLPFFGLTALTVQALREISSTATDYSLEPRDLYCTTSLSFANLAARKLTTSTTSKVHRTSSTNKISSVKTSTTSHHLISSATKLLPAQSSASSQRASSTPKKSSTVLSTAKAATTLRSSSTLKKTSGTSNSSNTSKHTSTTPTKNLVSSTATTSSRKPTPSVTVTSTRSLTNFSSLSSETSSSLTSTTKVSTTKLTTSLTSTSRSSTTNLQTSISVTKSIPGMSTLLRSPSSTAPRTGGLGSALGSRSTTISTPLSSSSSTSSQSRIGNSFSTTSVSNTVSGSSPSLSPTTQLGGTPTTASATPSISTRVSGVSSTVSTIPSLSLTLASTPTSNPATSSTVVSSVSSTTPTLSALPALITLYAGPTFFDEWNFEVGADPTVGLADFQNQSSALALDLAYVRSDGVAVLAIDSTSILAPNVSRSSVRIISQAVFDMGTLIIADFPHVPHGCTVWPAFWMLAAQPEYQWPYGGEIDIVEGIHNRLYNQQTMHTGPNCTRAPGVMSGTPGSHSDCDCTVVHTGCNVADAPGSFGTGLNAGGGATWAMKWDTTGISTWRWNNGSVPLDVQLRTPAPSTWGIPVGAWGASTCDPSTHFRSMNMIFDITTCGEWAGQATTWKNSGCQTKTYPTCNSAVSDPGNFKDAYFLINSIAVYQI